MSDIEADDYECPHCCGTGEVQCVNLGPDGFSESLPCPTCVSREYEGYRSPAEVAEIDKAAQAEMKERAAKVACDNAEKWNGYGIAVLIRDLTPSSGPWQRVPEGFCVVREEERINIYDRMRAVEKRAYDEVEKELQEEMSKANADFLAKALAMLAEVKK